MEIKRDRYLQQLIESRQDGFIKVVTGIRRCGKSYLLNVLFYHYLLENGIADDHIIRIDLEDRMNKDLRNPDMMLHYVHDRIKDKELYYIIIDEVQLMDEFVDVLNSFRHIENADTYVTGSNSHFLSSDIPTEFRGRGETFHVNPLSFSEFYLAKGGDKQDAWREYFTILMSLIVGIRQLPASQTEWTLTCFFTIFVMLQFWNLFNASVFGTNHSVFKDSRHALGMLSVAVIILIGQIFIVEFGGKVFRTVPLNLPEWIIIITATSLVLVAGEIYRLIKRLQTKKSIR